MMHDCDVVVSQPDPSESHSFALFQYEKPGREEWLGGKLEVENNFFRLHPSEIGISISSECNSLLS